MMPDTPTPTPKVTYWAISILSSRTFWLNVMVFVLAASSLSEVTAIIPARFLPLETAVGALINLYLRTVTVRPVAFIMPGETAPVAVDKIIDAGAAPRVRD